MDFRDWLCALLAPSSCMFCGRAVRDFCDGTVCRSCWDRIRPMRADCLRCGQQYAGGVCAECAQCRGLLWLEIARSYGLYRGLLGSILRQYKYRCDRSLGDGLARLLGLTFQRNFQAAEWDALTVVPTHPSRIRERGFDHLALLARLLGKQLRLPCRRVLARRLPSRPQAGLSEKERRRNVRRSFTALELAAGSRLLLLDDIFTTGATVNECARVLKKAGAVRVGVLTVARAE
ncbi:MAG: ComF family protein [Acidobacteria bacterium]|nr:ComF family protein [Acidobacteriota bacterium]